MKWIYFVIFPALSLAALSLSAQSVPSTTGDKSWSPWEVTISGNFTRANFPAIANSLTVLDSQLSSAGKQPIYTNSNVNEVGAEINLQQNLRTWLGFQFDVSGGTTVRNVTVPAADSSTLSGVTSFRYSPTYFSAGYGPVVTLRRSDRIQPWARLLGSAARANLCPSSELKTAVWNNSKKFAFADTSGAIDGGLGADLMFNQKLVVRISVDDVRTWLFGAHQNQMCASVGIDWKFGRGANNYND
jgi:hypothetical protein